MQICIVQGSLDKLSETFLRAQAERLPEPVTVVHGKPPRVGDRPVLSQAAFNQVARKVSRVITRRTWHWERTAAYLRALREIRPDVVLAQYGPVGVSVMEACELANVPLVVQFHGYDASKFSVIETYAERYQQLFKQAAAVVGVSKAMVGNLQQLGAPANKLRYNCYGVDVNQFSPGDPGAAPPTIVTTSNLVEKKAPHLTILAFAKVVEKEPSARLRVIGDGPLRGLCEQLVGALKLNEVVTFLGAQGHSVVQQEMGRARCFAQHSVRAQDGNAEGTPNVVLEAGASGLPVVSTNHAGIPEVVIDGETGLLCDELDVNGMAENMLRLIRQPQLASEMGCAARRHVENNYSMDISIRGLWSILSECAERSVTDDDDARQQRPDHQTMKPET